MSTNLHKNILYRYLPISLCVILISLAVLVFFLSRNSSPENSYHTAVDLSHPIIKNPDAVAKVKQDTGVAKRDRIQVKFFWEVDGYKYNDALYFTPEEYAALAPEKLEALKYERLKNWANLVNEQSNKASPSPNQ